MPFCRKCGEQIVGDAIFCVKCGTSIYSKDKDEKVSTDSDKIQEGQIDWADLDPGFIIDERLEILEKLSKLEYKAVYKVLDKEDNLEKTVRVLPASVVRDKAVLFEVRQETRMMISLEHPNILRVYDFVQTAGESYILTEYITGKKLNEIKNEYADGKLPEEQVKEYGLKIAEGMAYAHSKGIIHKELRLQSVIVTNEGVVKIADFGIAKLIRGEDKKKADEGDCNPQAYISPEQMKGELIKKATDIYSFGIILYELLNGKPPFSQGDLYRQIISSKPQDIDNVSDGMNKIIRKCLEKHPERRYESFSELSVSIYKGLLPEGEEKVSEDSGEIAEEGFQYRAKAKTNKAKLLLAGVIKYLLILVLLASAGYGVYRLIEYRSIYIEENLALAEKGMQEQNYTAAKEAFNNILSIDRKNSQALEGLRQIYVIEGQQRINDPNMVFVQGGTFFMGSNEGRDDEKPVHTVSLDDFYIAKFPVTQRQWRYVTGNNPSRFKGDSLPVENLSWYDIIAFCNLLSIREGLTPVYSINNSTNPSVWGRVPDSKNPSWDGLRADWDADGYRLPTEAEWEYAARGGNLSKGYLYSGSNNIDEVGWYINNSGGSTRPVGLKAPNELGLYDMSGNVWEWCWNIYGQYVSGHKSNPKGVQSGDYCVIRGGSWHDRPEVCRTTNRGYDDPSSRVSAGGFRYVRVLR